VGVALLLLRLTVGGALLGQGALASRGGALASWSVALGVAAILSGGALVAGALTPVTSVVASALCVGLALAPPGAGGPGGPEGVVAFGLLFVIGVAVALMGPGAYSIDCRLFGRREIVVPRTRPGVAPSNPAGREHRGDA
jgi:hypothetical protein